MIQDKAHSPIFVTGIERSGSSIVANIVSICGAFSGKCNPMYENVGLKGVVDAFYKKQGVDVRGQYPLPDFSSLEIPVDWGEKVEKVLGEEGYDFKRAWMYKGSRVAQIWPIWAYAYPNAKWVIVRRRTGDVLDSCLKTGFMEAFKDPTIRQLVGVEDEREGWLWWVHEHEKRFIDMIQGGLNCKVIWPERTLTGDFRQIYEMLDWLGLPWNKGVLDVLESKLIKNQRNG